MAFTNPYSSVSVSGYNANPPSDDGTEAAQNEVSWDNHKSKLGDPIKDAVESVNSNANSSFSTVTTNLNTVDNRTTSYGDIGGIFISNNASDAEHDVDFSAGRCRDAADTLGITFTATTKRIDGTWVAGSGNGGLASGVSLSADTWYACHAIQDANGTVDAGFDNSTTAANLLADSGYTKYRRVGWVRTDSSSNILGFYRVGGWYFFNTVPALDYDDNPSTTATTVTATAPPMATIVKVSLYLNNSESVRLYHPAGDDTAPSASAAPLTTARSIAGTAWAFSDQVPTNSSAQFKMIQTTGRDTKIATLGWLDPRE